MRRQNLLYYKNATLLKNALSFFVQSVLQTSDTVIPIIFFSLPKFIIVSFFDKRQINLEFVFSIFSLNFLFLA